MEATLERVSQTAPSEVPKTAQSASGPTFVVSVENLHELQTRPSFGEYCRQLWERRAFIWADAKFKALRTTKDYRLWRTWLVLQPLLDVAFYAFLFGLILKTSRGIENFVGFLILGVIFMRMIAGLMTQGIMLIRNSRGMVQTFDFPKASLAISQTLRSMLDNILPALMAVLMALAAQKFSPLNWSIVLVVPLFILAHIFGCGLMLVTARLTAVIPDAKAIINFLSQAWFFLSGVMFSIDRFVNHPMLLDVMTANPAYIFLTAIRGSVLYGDPPSAATWMTLIAWSFGTLLLGKVYFWQAEARYVRLS